MQLRRKLRGVLLHDAPDPGLTFDGAWEALPPAQREVIDTIVRDGISLSRCATRLGLDIEDVRRFAVQGMRTLRTANSIDRPTWPGTERPPTAERTAVARPGSDRRRMGDDRVTPSV